MRVEDKSELEQFIILLHHPNLKIPTNLRLYLVSEEGREYYVKDGKLRQEYLNEFQWLTANRGVLLEAFARFEFLIGEIIRLKIIGFETEPNDMIIDLISAINLNRQISLLSDWKIIDSDLKKKLNALIMVRNGLAHKFFEEDVTYKNNEIMGFGESKSFDGFIKDLKDAWKNLVKIYVKEQEKIDFKDLANQLRKLNNFNPK